MRIIAGRLKGRRFSSPRGHRTHPMSDKMRGALFNALGDLDGLTVLDAFAGSGALSFEAISRGAHSALAIDIERTAQITIAENIKELALSDQVRLIKASASSWVNRSKDEFDIVLLDPPYGDFQINLVERLALKTRPGGIAVFSLPKKARLILPENFEQIQFKSYGDGTLSFYRRRA
jgi:16S rRNA (guanine966-N2)-methyltransferase